MSEPVIAPSLSFVGDFVAPQWCVPHLTGFKAWLGESVVVANLEGPIVSDFVSTVPRSNMKFNIASAPGGPDALGPAHAICSIANNHYEDFEETHPPAGGHPNLHVIGDQSGTACLCRIGGREVALVGVALPATDPARWRSLKRIAIDTPSALLRLLETARARHPGAFLIAVVHWGYEFSRLPFPADRAWARRAFDAGVDMVIGHHPHVIQPVEDFGGKTVAYSLGNFFFPDGDYFGKTSKFPDICRQGLAARFDGTSLSCFVTEPDYVGGDVGARPVIATDSIAASFAGQSDGEYREYFMDQLRAKRARVPPGIPPSRDYFAFGGWSETGLLAVQDARQLARNGLIRLGIRNPYRGPRRKSSQRSQGVIPT